MTTWISERELVHFFLYVTHFLSKYLASPTLILCCLLSSLGHSILYSWCSQRNSSLYASHRGCGAKEDPSNMATPKIYSSCASCAELRNNQAYYREHANYHHNVLFLELRSNQFALQFALQLIWRKIVSHNPFALKQCLVSSVQMVDGKKSTVTIEQTCLPTILQLKCICHSITIWTR